MFRITIGKYVPLYSSLNSRSRRAQLILKLVDMIHHQGGRFLKKRGNLWVVLNLKHAREKVGHALRDTACQQLGKSPMSSASLSAVQVREASRPVALGEEAIRDARYPYPQQQSLKNELAVNAIQNRAIVPSSLEISPHLSKSHPVLMRQLAAPQYESVKAMLAPLATFQHQHQQQQDAAHMATFQHQQRQDAVHMATFQHQQQQDAVHMATFPHQQQQDVVHSYPLPSESSRRVALGEEAVRDARYPHLQQQTLKNERVVNAVQNRAIVPSSLKTSRHFSMTDPVPMRQLAAPQYQSVTAMLAPLATFQHQQQQDAVHMATFQHQQQQDAVNMATFQHQQQQDVVHAYPLPPQPPQQPISLVASMPPQQRFDPKRETFVLDEYNSRSSLSTTSSSGSSEDIQIEPIVDPTRSYGNISGEVIAATAGAHALQKLKGTLRKASQESLQGTTSMGRFNNERSASFPQPSAVAPSAELELPQLPILPSKTDHDGSDASTIDEIDNTDDVAFQIDDFSNGMDW